MTHRVVGQSVPRIDARAKVTGAARYAIDMTQPGMLHGVAVRSERAHARIARIHTDDAQRASGIVAVITADDLADLDPYYGHIIRDHPVLAIDRVRFMGEPVALVVGRTRLEALAAAEEVRVEYEDLDSVIDLEAALSDDAPLVHDSRYRRGTGVAWETVPDDHLGTNVAHEAHLEWGDVDDALSGAHLVVETTGHYPMLYAYAMEPYNALADYQPERLHIISSTQHPFMVRAEVARIFRMPHSAVHVEAPYVGGGYGSKSWTKVEPLAAVGAYITRRPVRVALSVEEAMLTTRADSARVAVRTGLDAEGRILGRDLQIDFNTGAYADSSPSILDKSVHRSFGPYQIPNLRIHARLVYTNTVPASSYRGFGAPQGNLACEYNLDRAAALLGLDGREIRRRNLLPPGGQVLPGKRPLDADLVADLDMLVDALEDGDDSAGGDDRAIPAIGFGCSASDAGAFPASTAVVRIGPDGAAFVTTGAVEMGQGSSTVLSQIAAEELGLPLDSVGFAQASTIVGPFERATNGSRTTTLVGLAVQRAARSALEEVKRMAVEVWQVDPEDVSVADGCVRAGEREATYGEIVTNWFGIDGGEAIGIGLVRRDGDTKAMPPFWEIGMAGVRLQVDPETGEVRLLRLATVGDVGFAINPAAMEGQDLGAATQGLGAALFEELTYDGGQLTNPNLVDYRVPRATDLPSSIVTQLAQRADGIGPYGAKGGGEGSLNPVGGAVMSAVARATGRWPSEVRLPLTPERVWRLIRDGEA